MTIALTRPGKHALHIDRPLMNAAGTFGFADEYRHLISLDKLGALITNPVTHAPRSAANGTRVVPLDAGLLLHTGLPNPGVRKTIELYREAWARLPVPLIVHLAVGSADELERSLAALEAEDAVAGIELGVQDDWTAKEAAQLLKSAQHTDKPLLFRLPFGASTDYAKAVVDAGVGGLTVSAPPRGTARSGSGRLIAGRLYGTWILPLTLRLVGQIARKVSAPVIACGGVHSVEDARSYLEAGAVAVQIDALAWSRPAQVELLARDLAGLVSTQPVGALADEWYPGMTDDEKRDRENGGPQA